MLLALPELNASRSSLMRVWRPDRRKIPTSVMPPHRMRSTHFSTMMGTQSMPRRYNVMGVEHN